MQIVRIISRFVANSALSKETEDGAKRKKPLVGCLNPYKFNLKENGRKKTCKINVPLFLSWVQFAVMTTQKSFVAWMLLAGWVMEGVSIWQRDVGSSCVWCCDMTLHPPHPRVQQWEANTEYQHGPSTSLCSTYICLHGKPQWTFSFVDADSLNDKNVLLPFGTL